MKLCVRLLRFARNDEKESRKSRKTMFKTIHEDVQSVLDRDPAARNVLEVLLCYPGLHAIWAQRLAHKLWKRGFKLIARGISQLTRGITGIEIHPGATIGRNFFMIISWALSSAKQRKWETCASYHGSLGRAESAQDHASSDYGVQWSSRGRQGVGRSHREHIRIGANAWSSNPRPLFVGGLLCGRSSYAKTRPYTRRKADLEHGILPTTSVRLCGVDANVNCFSNASTVCSPEPASMGRQCIWHWGDFSI